MYYYSSLNKVVAKKCSLNLGLTSEKTFYLISIVYSGELRNNRVPADKSCPDNISKL